MCFISTMEYYTAANRNAVLIHGTTWMNQKNYVKLDKHYMGMLTFP